ncbi:hypothetical protein NDU88_004250 [Pleurodeles waltl]|uniref:Immunoglobulin domain-containing protein n=1 Tax=Pleurodeles waltl TaxID=8319 RepID=A0AAV7QFK1_PLEWA|nr:hypothetical protein NDU88_004250 [Pleurodeles waltl]
MLPLQAFLTLLLLSGYCMVCGEFATVVSAVPGSWITLRCHYNPQLHSQAEKVWCLETPQAGCQRVVATSSAPMAVLNRARIRDDPWSGTVTIIMDALRSQDSGRYHCLTIDPTNVYITRTIQLEVQSAPKWMLVAEGSSTSMQCHYSATDYHLVSRVFCRLLTGMGCQSMRGTQAFPISGATERYTIVDDPIKGIIKLSIEGLLVEDSGLYECRLQLPGTPMVMKKFQLQVRKLENSGRLHLNPSSNSIDTNLPTSGTLAEERSSGNNRHMIMIFGCSLAAAFLLIGSVVGTLIFIRRRRKTEDLHEAPGYPSSVMIPTSEVSKERGKIVPNDLHDENDFIKYTTLRLEPKSGSQETTYANVRCQPRGQETPISPSILAVSGTVEYATVFFRPSGALLPAAQ